LLQDGTKAVATGLHANKDCTWKVSKASVPFMPDWTILRQLNTENQFSTGTNNKPFSKLFGGGKSLNKRIDFNCCE